jgi:hypothetical protein
VIDTSIQVEAAHVARAIDRLSFNFGIPVDQAIEVQMGLILQRVQKWTPPHRGRGGNTIADRQAGERAVSREIQRLFLTPWEVFDIARREKSRAFARVLHRAIRERNVALVQELARQVPSLSTITVALAPDEGLHRRSRNRRGKVPKNEKPKQIVLTERQLKRYVGRVRKHVGKAKKGWSAGLDGSRARQKSPAWVKRVQGTRGRWKKPNVQRGVPAEAANDAPSIGSLERRLVRESMRAQARALTNQVQGALRHAARKEGLLKQYGR